MKGSQKPKKKHEGLMGPALVRKRLAVDGRA